MMWISFWDDVILGLGYIDGFMSEAFEWIVGGIDDGKGSLFGLNDNSDAYEYVEFRQGYWEFGVDEMLAESIFPRN